MDDLIREFLIESNDGLDCMERSLTELELRPSDPALLAEIFRAVHTIKGTTGFLGFRRLETLAHSGENILGLLRENKLKVTPEIITLLLRMLDGLRVILKNIDAKGVDGDPDPLMDAVLIRELNTLISNDAEANNAENTIPPQTENRWARTTNEIPEVADAPAVAEIPNAVIPGSVEECKLAPDAEPMHNRRATDPQGSSVTESTLRVDVELLNRMMNLVGELVLTRNQILQHAVIDDSFNTLARRLDMVTADLRESVMKARMQPVNYIFQKFPRMVRDLCHICSKQVQLELVGKETELDKSLLEAIKDPLTHAVRNSIDHGIENEAVRLAAGKSIEGTLRLRAAQEGSHVLVEVTDDGRGMDPQVILKKALDKGLVTPERAATMTDRESLNLIFMPGFSTAEKVTNVSGRGVGMDVVRTNVEKIGGTVEVESALGRGTTIRLRIPLTLAIVPALVVRSCGEIFAIPQSALFELVYVGAQDAHAAFEYVDNAPVYRLRGELLPLVRLADLLHLNAAGAGAKKFDGKKFYMVVLETDGKRFGLVVDELLDPEEIVVKPLSAVLRQVGLFSGATILGNGSLALILDPAAAAMKANISMRKMHASTVTVAGPQAVDGSPQYLVYSVDGGVGANGTRLRRMAMPLEMVDRIETVPFSRIEYAGERPLMQYLGALLPLIDEGGMLQELAAIDSATAEKATVEILVYSHEGRAAGIVVREVLDVARGSLFENSDLLGDGETTTKLARIGERVTVLQQMDGLAVDTVPAQKEVA